MPQLPCTPQAVFTDTAFSIKPFCKATLLQGKPFCNIQAWRPMMHRLWATRFQIHGQLAGALRHGFSCQGPQEREKRPEVRKDLWQRSWGWEVDHFYFHAVICMVKEMKKKKGKKHWYKEKERKWEHWESVLHYKYFVKWTENRNRKGRGLKWAKTRNTRNKETQKGNQAAFQRFIPMLDGYAKALRLSTFVSFFPLSKCSFVKGKICLNTRGATTPRPTSLWWSWSHCPPCGWGGVVGVCWSIMIDVRVKSSTPRLWVGGQYIIYCSVVMGAKVQ